MCPRSIPISLFAVMFLLLFSWASSEDDVKCLQELKKSLTGPGTKLDSWSFTNTSVGYICDFDGISCWNVQENRLIGLLLRDFGLTGTIPDSLQFCHSLQTLDLASNALSGSIPPQICSWLPYLVTLDLSHNDLTGQIPEDLANCSYLNSLILSDNSLSGAIPYQFSHLGRLKKFSVANNDLTGRVPSFSGDLLEFDYGGNAGLCGGGSLGKCGGLSKKSLAIIITAGAVGAAVSLLLGFCLWWQYVFKANRKRKRGDRIGGSEDGSSWAEKLMAHKLTQVVLFQKPLVKLKLADLSSATINFNAKSVIASSPTGTTYKAVLPDGSTLAVKRLSPSAIGEKQFRMEMNSLGQLRHPNLVPLLGFCLVEEEKLLVYKHLSNGTLSSMLYDNPGSLDWKIRFHIALGAARGLAWLHHGCHPPISHQNLTSNVVLLDEDFDARIMDFGLSRLVISPEHQHTASLKGDTYCFGVILLELATGQKQKPLRVCSVEEELKGDLVEWVDQLWEAGRIEDGIDTALRGRGDEEVVVRLVKIARKCVVANPKERWSMYEVYEALKGMGEEAGFSEQYDEFPLIAGEW